MSHNFNSSWLAAIAYGSLLWIIFLGFFTITVEWENVSTGEARMGRLQGWGTGF